MSFNDYPEAASNNARRALEWVEKYGWQGCGTPIGKYRAYQLANRKGLSLQTVKRMAAFNRHRKNSTTPYSFGCGKLMWDCWGGAAGINWAIRTLKNLGL